MLPGKWKDRACSTARLLTGASAPTCLLLPTATCSPLLRPKAAASRPAALHPIMLLLRLTLLKLLRPVAPTAAAVPRPTAAAEAALCSIVGPAALCGAGCRAVDPKL